MTGTCGTSAGACSGDAAAAPVTNPAGLTEIAYRVDDFAGFRQALLTPLPGEEQLTGWSPEPGDLGLQVLEWWAYLADILTFYNERIANSGYLRTAVAQPGPRHNVARLARLLGYQPRPGITATGVVAAIRSAGSPDGKLVVPSGVQITSTPSAGAPAQLFETGLSDANQTPSFPGASDGLIVLPPDRGLFPPAQQASGQSGGPAASQKSVLLAGQVTVTRGEQLVLVKRNWEGKNDDWALVTAGSATTEPDPNGPPPNTRVPVDSADWHDLGTADPSAAEYQLLRTAATAPLWTLPTVPGSHGLVIGGRGGAGGGGAGGAPARAGGGPSASQVPGAPSQPAGAPDSPWEEFTVPLASLVRSVAPGDNVLFTGSTSDTPPQQVQVLAHVLSYHEVVTRVRPAGSGGTPPVVLMPHTRLRVRALRADARGLERAVDRAELDGIVMRYSFREAGTLIPTPAPKLTSFPATVAGPPGLVLGQQPVAVALQDANGKGMTAQAVSAGSGSVTLTAAKGNPGDLPLVAPIRLFADLVNVSRGTTVRAEILGNGNPAAASQSFVLRHSPLVYVPAPATGEPVSTLTVTVDGAAWQEVPAFAGQAPGATVYVVRELADGRTQVVFGDGADGARLPLGVSNVTATYRYGRAGPPPPAGHLTTVLQPQPGLASVANPVGISPGTDPEPPRQTAGAAPATVVLLPAATVPAGSPPVISPGDCERLAATVAGVTRVRAYWTWDQARQRPSVTLYVGGTTGTEAATVRTALAAGGTPRIPLHVLSARAVHLNIRCQLLCPPGTTTDAAKDAAVSALTDAHTGLFSPGRMAIGQRLYRSQVEAALATTGAIAVLGLHIERSAPGGPGGAADDKPTLDPGQDGYFSLLASGVNVGVVIQ